ncbi:MULTISPECIES: hypothetical protein [Streptomyces]|nr:hypothetical protein [Streptomyces actuosus]MBM4820763.1 hypothetical protein [Streptomyces actuosus]
MGTPPYPPPHQQQPLPGNPYAAQAGYAPSAPQPPYAQPYPPQYAQPHSPPCAQPYGAYAQGPACRICGATPAAPMTVRQHTGLLVGMRFSKVEGPLCRSCGTAIHRDLTTKTLAGGWWSPLSMFLFCPVTLLANLALHFRLKKLPYPVTPPPTGVVMNPGKPIHRRPAAYVMACVAAFYLSVALIGVLGG